MYSAHFPRILAAMVLIAALCFTTGTMVVTAADPVITADPVLVPFSPVPGQPGITTLTFNSNGIGVLFACGQDNNRIPTFLIGPIPLDKALKLNFPYIQAGRYTFWVSADSSCDLSTKYANSTGAIETTVLRVGPTGKAGRDDIALQPNNRDQTVAANQTFPLPGEQVCIMSGSGAQVNVQVEFSQDKRLYGFDAATRTLMPYAGQNGCYPFPWIVNGSYIARIADTPAAASIGFCTGENKPTAVAGILPPPDVTGAPPVPGGGAWHCAQIAYQAVSGDAKMSITQSNVTLNRGSTITGTVLTGADNHAVQVCAYAFTGTSGPNGTVNAFGSIAQSYNGSGAANITPIPLDFLPQTWFTLFTYDLTNPATPGGVGAAQQLCPTPTATFLNGAVTGVAITPNPPNMNLIDEHIFVVK